jgi:hypothetical protein
MKKAFLAICILVGMAGLSVYVLKRILKSMNELKIDTSFDLDSDIKGQTENYYSSTTTVYLKITKGIIVFRLMYIT